MRVRKSVNNLTGEERQKFIHAVLRLKEYGAYDQYVRWHHHSMMTMAVLPGEPESPDYRNIAHRGPAFLPWHREFLRRFELDLREIDGEVTLPYWDWAADAALADPAAAPVWGDDFMGGDGVEAEGWKVTSGPFAHDKGNWAVSVDPDNFGPALLRQFRQTDPNVQTLPNIDDVGRAIREQFYDTPQWNSSPFTLGFRNRLEGWISRRGDNGVQSGGSQLHNRVHVWIGGNMASSASPNDPVFFLNHCFVDKLWADWQAQQLAGDAMGELSEHYVPSDGGPPGHNLRDPMYPWPATPQDVLDHRQLGYLYDAQIMPEAVEERVLTFSGITAAGQVEIPKRTPFSDPLSG